MGVSATVSSIGIVLLLFSVSDALLPRSEISEQREFDYFILALLWPGTLCRGTDRCCPSNACCRGENAPTEFTIHGLWSNYNDDTWPACCNGPAFNLKEVSTLLSALEEYWPTLSCDASSTCDGGKGLFWAHEWEKHGTCSSSVVHTEYDYFLTTLNLYFKYNITKVLNDAGYLPSNSEKYPLGGIITAIQNSFHATPLLVCSNGAVEELRLCFYKDFQPRDCVKSNGLDNMLSMESSCPDYVSLPESASLGLGNDQAFQEVETF
ncbi:ribonuclease 2-like [Impatiens glandulifera]|uniref:ribonuclease 2-like n=1 Tax=Impatiens glandulifera TaxID=253017 RepID=UPI001FB0BA9F|nr:ribonuclease 2-like [Impatiens glandulifera]